MVIEWSKTLKSQIQVEDILAKVPGSNPAWDLHAIFGSKSIMLGNFNIVLEDIDSMISNQILSAVVFTKSPSWGFWQFFPLVPMQE